MRALIVGGGWMGRLHAECLSEMAGIEVAGLVEPSAESASGFTATFDVPVFSSLRPAVTDLGRVDIACIAAPTGLHAPLAIEALAAGLHVVIEKPVATTVPDAERMIAAARAADRTLSVILQYRFNRDALRLKRAVDADALGDIVFANVVNYISRDVSYFAANGGWRGTWELNGGGILINQSTHGMDLLDWCMGPIVEARAFAGTRFHGVEVEDNLSAAVRFATGATGIVQVTSGADQNYPRDGRIRARPADGLDRAWIRRRSPYRRRSRPASARPGRGLRRTVRNGASAAVQGNRRCAAPWTAAARVGRRRGRVAADDQHDLRRRWPAA
jgi:UDP-N-acetyl-2-amino-2-deoxyglucuronate dehydrogenase